VSISNVYASQRCPEIPCRQYHPAPVGTNFRGYPPPLPPPPAPLSIAVYLHSAHLHLTPHRQRIHHRSSHINVPEMMHAHSAAKAQQEHFELSAGSHEGL